MSTAGESGQMKKILFAVDIDGTLLHGEEGISGQTIRLAKELVDRGGFLSLFTGRSMQGVRRILPKLPINAPCALLTGTLYYDPRSGLITKKILLDKHCLGALDNVKSKYAGIAIQVFTESRVYTCQYNDILLLKGVREELADVLTSLDAIHEPVMKILLVHPDASVLEACRDLFVDDRNPESPGRGCNFEFASRHFVEIVSAKAGKGIALKEIAQSLGIDRDNIYTAGNGLTDLSMFEESGFSFAPVDSAKQVRDNADRIIPSAKENGIQEAFEYILTRMG